MGSKIIVVAKTQTLMAAKLNGCTVSVLQDCFEA
jgi:hypothetical protein